MEKKKHFIKVFFTDDETNNILNFDGQITECYTNTEEFYKAIGRDIANEIDEAAQKSDEASYGYRIDYTLTPITTDPFK